MERLPHAQRSVTISTLSPTSTIPCTRIVHFVIGRKAEVAKFQSNTPDDQIKGKFNLLSIKILDNECISECYYYHHVLYCVH